MTDLLTALREAKITAKGEIRDRTLPQKDLKEIEKFGEAEREIILQVGKGEKPEAILRANHGLHLIQHAPTPAEPQRFEIRSISEPASPMSWIALLLIVMAAILFAWQQHGRRSAVRESDGLRLEIGTLHAAIGSMKEENDRQKSELAAKDGKLGSAEKKLTDQAALVATLQSQLKQMKDACRKNKTCSQGSTPSKQPPAHVPQSQ